MVLNFTWWIAKAYPVWAIIECLNDLKHKSTQIGSSTSEYYGMSKGIYFRRVYVNAKLSNIWPVFLESHLSTRSHTHLISMRGQKPRRAKTPRFEKNNFHFYKLKYFFVLWLWIINIIKQSVTPNPAYFDIYAYREFNLLEWQIICFFANTFSWMVRIFSWMKNTFSSICSISYFMEFKTLFRQWIINMKYWQ